MRSPIKTIDPFGDDEKNDGLIKRLRIAGREVINDPGVKAGVAQVLASVASLALRSLSPKGFALTRMPRNED